MAAFLKRALQRTISVPMNTLRSSRFTLQVNRKFFCTGSLLKKELNQPLGANVMPRAGGIASFMRLPVQSDAKDLDACFVGIPLDIGTSNRSGTRFGPRQIRTESSLLRPYNQITRAAPFESLQVADIGDCSCNIYNLPKAVKDIKQYYTEILKTGCKPITLGGDHTVTYPILQAIKEVHGGPVALIHVDAHADTSDTMLGEKIAHGTPFRRAVEENLIVSTATIQIGLRSSGYSANDFDWGRDQGFRVVTVDDCWHKSLKPLMEEVKEKLIPADMPVYLSFDIDGIDPAFAPGTGTPEIAGLTPIQGLEIVRGCRGLNVIGADVVEVAPPYDPHGMTALLAANIAFEILCILPGVKYH